jgi:hypothetical protein
MKLTKSKLKQLIKEVFEDEEDFLAKVPEGEEQGVEADAGDEYWVKELENFMERAADLYDSLPDEGKGFMTKNFQMYAEKWEEELEGDTEEEYEEDEGEYEKLRGVYGRKTQRGTPLSPTQAVWATKRGYPFQSEK